MGEASLLHAGHWKVKNVYLKSTNESISDGVPYMEEYTPVEGIAGQFLVAVIELVNYNKILI